MTREECLELAAHLITNDRADQYGDAADTHERIGDMWAAVLDCPPISSEQVALMMICLKIVRAAKRPEYEDSWVDIAGYAALGGEMASSL